jgi:vacuolar-type H+-ATPase subunit D/Vma8
VTDAYPDKPPTQHDPLMEIMALMKIMQTCMELLGKRIDHVNERVNLLEPK